MFLDIYFRMPVGSDPHWVWWEPGRLLSTAWAQAVQATAVDAGLFKVQLDLSLSDVWVGFPSSVEPASWDVENSLIYPDGPILTSRHIDISFVAKTNSVR